MKASLTKLFLLFIALMNVIVTPGIAHAVDSVCSKVSMNIVQELSVERIAFDAKMVITNNMPEKSMDGVNVDIKIADASGKDASSLFYIRKPSLTNIVDVAGNGSVAAAQQAEIHWLIIPTPGAGGTQSSGIVYSVGATLSYSISGINENIEITPDFITVKPEAQLVLDYFTPNQVLGDDPFTLEAETPEPFPLAIRVTNIGYGDAKKVNIESAQPVIIDNNQGLLVDFTLLGTYVNDVATTTGLKATIGTLTRNKITTAYWEMIASLDGKFKDFNVSFTHDADLGGQMTSIINSINSYYFSHFVISDIGGRDLKLDILADTDGDDEHLPDMMFESEVPAGMLGTDDSRAQVFPANVHSISARPTPEAPEVYVDLESPNDGWIYVQIDDPSDGLNSITGMTRGDGKTINEHNYWTTEFKDGTLTRQHKVHFIDHRENSDVTNLYVIRYSAPEEDVVPPVSKLKFNGPHLVINGVDYVDPSVVIDVVGSDNYGGSGIANIYRMIEGMDNDFVESTQVAFTEPGTYVLWYYGRDNTGNTEETRRSVIVVDSGSPDIKQYSAVPDKITNISYAGVQRDGVAKLSFMITDDVPVVNAAIKISSGDVYSDSNIVGTYSLVVNSGSEASVEWSGHDASGNPLPLMDYTARLYVTDNLSAGIVQHNSQADIPLTIKSWLDSSYADENAQGQQLNPDVSGEVLVWQDSRSGRWDIYMKDLGSGAAAQPVAFLEADQVDPSVSGDMIVWADKRTGNWDIYAYSISGGGEIPVYTGSGDQTLPVVYGTRVAWQDNSAGNWNICMRDMTAVESVCITNHERDQMHPSISDQYIAWEDYRHGQPEIYLYDCSAGFEKRLTFDDVAQTLPTVDGLTVAWTSQEAGGKDIYYMTSDLSIRQMTYLDYDQSNMSVSSNRSVYVDFGADNSKSDIKFFDMDSKYSLDITDDDFMQDNPSIDGDIVVWQDNDSGAQRIKWARLDVSAIQVVVDLKAGYNLIAAGKHLTEMLSSEMAVQMGISEIVTMNGLNKHYEVDNADFSTVLRTGEAVGVYVDDDVQLVVGDSDDRPIGTLYTGENYVGIFIVDPGYSAFDVLSSIGTDRVVSVRKYDSGTGIWKTAVVVQGSTGPVLAGVDFDLKPGDGVIINVSETVYDWVQ